eukprot:12640744-Alexandrium_andersonii.AAC.1
MCIRDRNPSAPTGACSAFAGGSAQPASGGRSVPTGGAAQQASNPLPDPWAVARRGQRRADPTHGQGRPQECSV